MPRLRKLSFLHFIIVIVNSRFVTMWPLLVTIWPTKVKSGERAYLQAYSHVSCLRTSLKDRSYLSLILFRFYFDLSLYFLIFFEFRVLFLRQLADMLCFFLAFHSQIFWNWRNFSKMLGNYC